MVYQVYPRSFKDVNGDGLGDIACDRPYPLLEGTGRGRHLALAVLFRPSWADGGYDVIDYRDVDPGLGTMDDFDAMAAPPA